HLMACVADHRLVVLAALSAAIATSSCSRDGPRAREQSSKEGLPSCIAVDYGLFFRTATPIDYVDQVVCDDGSGFATSDDPGPYGANCPCGSGNARKINVGEALPQPQNRSNQRADERLVPPSGSTESPPRDANDVLGVRYGVSCLG